jgi:molybdopterin-guanine dinucleotide biosynthesis protein B
VGYSGVGKTTLIEKLLPVMKENGFRIGTIKHHHNAFEMDRPGKDSWRHKKAGAATAMIVSAGRVGLIADMDREPNLDSLSSFFIGTDLILTEGYKNEKKPKIEVFRPDIHRDAVCKGDPNLIAVVSDAEVDVGVIRFTAEDIRPLARFIMNHFNLLPALSVSSQ